MPDKELNKDGYQKGANGLITPEAKERKMNQGLYESPEDSTGPKFVINSEPKTAQEVNPKIVYSLIDEPEDNCMILGRIFEVKKTIMTQSTTNATENDSNCLLNPKYVNHVNNVVCKKEDRFFTKIQDLMEKK